MIICFPTGAVLYYGRVTPKKCVAIVEETILKVSPSQLPSLTLPCRFFFLVSLTADLALVVFLPPRRAGSAGQNPSRTPSSGTGREASAGEVVA
jgi:hypothetical protein